MNENTRLDTHKRNLQTHCWVSATLNALVILLLCSALALREWVYYCYFKWGLYSADSTYYSLSRWVGADATYSTVHNDLCGDFEHIMDAACGDFCGNVRRLQFAGFAMTISIVITLMLCVGYLVLWVMSARKRHCKHLALYYGLWAAPAVYMIGLGLYLSLGNIYGTTSTYKHNQDMETELGLWLGYAISVLVFAPSVYSYRYTATLLT